MNQKNPDPLRPLRTDSVAIVGFGPTRDQAPWTDKAGWELWICNRLGLQPGVTRFDRHWDPHPFTWNERHFTADLWKGYLEWFKQDHGDSLIYVPESSDFPNAVPFPVQEIVNFTGRRYFTSAISYQIAFATMLGAKRIGLWGIDFKSDTEYAFERACAEYHLGIAQGRGIEIVFPAGAAMLNSDDAAPLYGIEEMDTPLADVELMLTSRIKEIDERMPKLQNQNDTLLREMYLGEGARLQSQEFLRQIREARRGGALAVEGA